MIETYWISVKMGPDWTPDCLRTSNIFESLPQVFAGGPLVSNTGLLCESGTATSFRMEGDSLERKETCFASHSPHIRTQMAAPTGLDSLMKALKKTQCTPCHSKTWSGRVVFKNRSSHSLKCNQIGSCQSKYGRTAVLCSKCWPAPMQRTWMCFKSMMINAG